MGTQVAYRRDYIERHAKDKLVIEIQPSADYLLHTDEETGVPAIKDGGKAAASKYYEKQTVEFEMAKLKFVKYFRPVIIYYYAKPA